MLEQCHARVMLVDSSTQTRPWDTPAQVIRYSWERHSCAAAALPRRCCCAAVLLYYTATAAILHCTSDSNSRQSQGLRWALELLPLP